MKMRLGFVSNSSSSSFVVTITKKAFDKALLKADEFTTAVINAMEKQESKFAGIDVITIGTHSDMGGGSEFDYMEIDLPVNENEEEPDKWEVYDNFISSIPAKDKVECSIDW